MGILGVVDKLSSAQEDKTNHSQKRRNMETSAHYCDTKYNSSTRVSDDFTQQQTSQSGDGGHVSVLSESDQGEETFINITLSSTGGEAAEQLVPPSWEH